MTDYIPGGHILLARQMSKSRIWIRHPLYLKLFTWILWTANHAEIKKGNHVYKRGELVTTYHEIIKAMYYYHNRQHIVPSLKQIRGILDWLKSEGMIEIYPIRTSELHNKGRPTVSTGAYVGIKIVVVNYNTYQTSENYKGRHKGRPSHELGHNNNNDYKKKIYIVEANIPYEEIINYLNEKTGKHFKSTSKTTNRLIRARWNEDKDYQDTKAFRFVIDAKCKDWLGDPKNEKYLRPETLFGTKFESYLNEKIP